MRSAKRKNRACETRKLVLPRRPLVMQREKVLAGAGLLKLTRKIFNQGSVVQKANHTIQWMNHYPLGKC